MISWADGKQQYDSKDNDMEHKLNEYCSFIVPKPSIRHKIKLSLFKVLNRSHKKHRAQLFVINVPGYQIEHLLTYTGDHNYSNNTQQANMCVLDVMRCEAAW